MRTPSRERIEAIRSAVKDRLYPDGRLDDIVSAYDSLERENAELKKDMLRVLGGNNELLKTQARLRDLLAACEQFIPSHVTHGDPSKLTLAGCFLRAQVRSAIDAQEGDEK